MEDVSIRSEGIEMGDLEGEESALNIGAKTT